MSSLVRAVQRCSACPSLISPIFWRDRNAFDRHGHCLCRLALYLPRVVDIELDMLAIARRGRRGDLRRALRREKAVQRTLWNDGHHSRAEDERFGRPVIAHDFQDSGAVEDVNQLVAGMRFPMILPRELDGEQKAVAIGRQSCDASLSI